MNITMCVDLQCKRPTDSHMAISYEKRTFYSLKSIENIRIPHLLPSVVAQNRNTAQQNSIVEEAVCIYL